MAEQYFSQSPSSDSRRELIIAQVKDTSLSFYTDAGTFSRDHLDEGSRILLESLPKLSGRIADLGCGWGAMGCFVAKWNEDADVYMVEVNERSAALARENAAMNEIGNAEVILGDGREALPGDLDAVVTNPPIRAGKKLIYALFEASHRALKGGGQLYIVIRKQQGAESALRFLQGLFGEAERIYRQKGFWVIRCIK